MRRWTRAPFRLICGGPCARLLQRGEPILELQAPEWSRPKIRCETCAGEPAPADLPPLVERTPVQPTTPARPVRTVTGLPADFKVAAAGEREIGQEG